MSYMIDPEHDHIDNNILSPNGRLGRMSFFILFCVLAVILFILYNFAVLLLIYAWESEETLLLAVLPHALVGIGIIIFLIAVFAYMKRCRDAGISPYCTFLAAVPVIGLILTLYLFAAPSVKRNDLQSDEKQTP